jgi:hypothetical protein
MQSTASGGRRRFRFRAPGIYRAEGRSHMYIGGSVLAIILIIIILILIF